MTKKRSLPVLSSLAVLLLACISFDPAAKPSAQDPSPAQPLGVAGPLSPRRANYDITVTLNEQSKTLRCEELLEWTNHTSDRVGELRFHLYLNAFRNSLSTHLRQARSLAGELNPNGWGGIDIASMAVVDGGGTVLEDLTGRGVFLHPDDDNADDRTVLSVPLKTPVPPKGTIRVRIAFIAKLPKLVRRTGYAERYYMIGQWFPKIGVYEGPGERLVPSTAAHGQWNCHQFHANSEFYSDFGVYCVTLHVPKDLVVGCSGVIVSETLSDSLKTVVCRAEDVHDFAWTASPEYTVFRDTYTSTDGHAVALMFYAQPAHVEQAHRHLSSAVIALRYFEEWCGVYPYTTLTVVDPSFDGNAAAGMEYPTLITAGSFWIMPAGVRFPELVTIHEFGHQFFYGMLASNEFEEAWLDEGMTQYHEISIFARALGSGKEENPYRHDRTSALDFAGFRMGDWEMARMAYTAPENARRDTIVKPVWTYRRGQSGVFSYNKPAIMLATLENHLGAAVMKRIMRTYFERYKFKHPTTRDFTAIVDEVTGTDMSWFFRQYLYGTAVLDLAVESISNTQVREPLGDLDSTMRARAVPDSGNTFRSRVVISRNQDGWMPAEVRIAFSDGSVVKDRWLGTEQYKVYDFVRKTTVVSASVDPEQKLLLDVNLTNNTLTVGEAAPGAWRWTLKILWWIQMAVQSAAALS